ncbi:zinc finger protein 185 [Hemicordylus capensis]|uniref:zinc finger protein 185 n=1 Tax=Hemicordylus capensis TaxID=884348 RepID=UPI0023029AA7|nr:zinc finger protein 185 [Hemicordylus capensis]
MKVRTTLKGDNSWIQKRSNSEEEQNDSPLHSTLRSRGADGRFPVSPGTLSPNRSITFSEPPSQAEPQSPSAKSPPRKSPSSTTSPSGYLIRGVFTKTIDKAASPPNTASNGSQKSAKSASLPRFSQGYKMSTEEYKRLAPYNVKRESSAPNEVGSSVSPDEQKKRTEAASSVLRRTASRERSYVLSAAKKSNGSPIQEAPPFEAKRVGFEDDIGPRSRSQTVPASAWSSSRGKSSTDGERRGMSGSPWSESRMASAASATSIDTGLRSQAPESYSNSSPMYNHFSSLESRNNSDQEKSELTSWDDCAPKITASSSNRWEKDEGNFQSTPGVERQGAILLEDSWEARNPRSALVNQMPPAPHITISPEASPKSRPSSHYRTRIVDTTVETHHRSKLGEYPSDVAADSARSALDHTGGNSSREVRFESPNARVAEFAKHQPVTARDSMNALSGAKYNVPIHLNDEEDIGPKRSFSAFERTSAREAAYESPSDTEFKKVEAHLAKSGSWSSESSLSTTRTQSELLRAAKREDSDLDSARSSSLSMESGVVTPESQEGEHASDSDTASKSYYPFRDNYATSSPRSHRVPFYKDNCETEIRRNLTSSDEKALFPSSTAAAFSQPRNPSASGYDSDHITPNRGLLFVKESVNSTERSSSPRFNSRSLVDLSELERSNYSTVSSLNSSPPKRPAEDICTYCGREIRHCAKITIENLKICCHEYCFRCGICHKPMGDLLDKIFIHRDIVHCDKCYEKLF